MFLVRYVEIQINLRGFLSVGNVQYSVLCKLYSTVLYSVLSGNVHY